MTREKAIEVIKRRQKCPECVEYHNCDTCDRDFDNALEMAIEVLNTEPCEDADNNYPLNMPTEEYRSRMIQAFHNADCDELIALVVMPTEKEFEQLEGLLKTHYKKQPCEDAVSREAVIQSITKQYMKHNELIPHWVSIGDLPSVAPKPRTGKWIMRSKAWKEYYVCSACGYGEDDELTKRTKFCPNCGAKMEGERANDKI